MGLLRKQYRDEDAAREYLEKLLWPNDPVCPKCGVIEKSTKLTRKEGTKTHGRKGLYQCNGCREQFTVTVGTIFEDSKIALHKWLLAFHLMCSSKKGISAFQLQRELELGSYRTAWFMCHRIRWAMTQTRMAEKLKGIVEVDDAFVGGKQKGGRRGRPTTDSTNQNPVLALVERDGDVRSFPIQRATLKNIKPILKEHLITDEFPVYYFMKPDFPLHRTINHRADQYVRKEAKSRLQPIR